MLRCNQHTELLTSILFSSSHTGTRAWCTLRHPVGDTLRHTHAHTLTRCAYTHLHRQSLTLISDSENASA